MIFDLLTPAPQGPRRRGPKNCAVACDIHVSKCQGNILSRHINLCCKAYYLNPLYFTEEQAVDGRRV